MRIVRCLVVPIALLLLIGILFSCIIFAENKAEQVYSSDKLKNNFRQIYRDDYYGFWKAIVALANKAKTCESEKDVSNFIDLINFGYGSAEFEEYYSKITERVLVSNPDCTLRALLMLNSESRKRALDRLRAPIFEPKSRMDEIFNGYRNSKEYKELVDSYFTN